MKTYFEYKVEEFMSKFGQIEGRVELGKHPSPEVRLLRARLILEETAELTAAMSEEDPIHEVADALADLLYVVIGTAIVYSIPIKPIFDEVHSSNMSKELGMHGMKRAIKGTDFHPPDLRKIIEGLL